MNDQDGKQRDLHERPHDHREDDAPADAGQERRRGGLSPWQIVGSTVASAFGVQSSRNRERDFSRGKASHFIIAGVVFTVVFVLGVILVVNLVLSAAA